MSVLNDISLALVTAVYDQLEGKPKRYGVVHGAVVFDECCRGMLWARWTGLYLSSSFPDEDTTATACSSQVWVADYEVGLLRCRPTFQESRHGPILPSAAQLAESADELATDARALLKGICTLAHSWPRSRRYIIGRVRPDESTGDCGGSVGTITVEL